MLSTLLGFGKFNSAIARAPFMGEHTAEIMESLLGIGIEEVAVLVAEGVLE